MSAHTYVNEYWGSQRLKAGKPFWNHYSQPLLLWARRLTCPKSSGTLATASVRRQLLDPQSTLGRIPHCKPRHFQWSALPDLLSCRIWIYSDWREWGVEEWTQIWSQTDLEWIPSPALTRCAATYLTLNLVFCRLVMILPITMWCWKPLPQPWM